MSVLRKIPVEEIRRRGEEGNLRRRLSGKDLVGFGVGIIIGTGIFTLTGVEAKQHAGPAIVISFVIGGIVAGLAALCYAEMASAVPTAGSAYTYAFATLGEIFGWIIGWDLLLEFVLGGAVVSRSWSGYLQNLCGLPTALFGEQSVFNLGAVLIIGVLAVVAIVGIRQSAWLTNALVIIKVTACVLIIGIGIFYVTEANLNPFVPPSGAPEAGSDVLHQPLIQAGLGIEQSSFGIGGVLTAAAVVFFAYTGFESLANLGEETRNPRKDMPVGVLGALGICTLLYIGVSFVVTGMVDYRSIDVGAPIADAFNQVGLNWVGVLISIGAITGLTSVMMVELVTIGRIGFTMARDGLLPAKLGEAHPRYGTPHRMTIAGVTVIMLLAGFVPLEEIADMVSIGGLSALLIVSLAVPVLRRTRPDLDRPFKVPFSPVLPIIAALACLYLMTNLDVLTWLRFAGWLAVGLAIYLFYGRRNSKFRGIVDSAKPGGRSG
jgi:APA family basic amino acid/polyamine antiporter